MASDNIRPLFNDDRWQEDEAPEPWTYIDPCAELEATYGSRRGNANDVAIYEDWSDELYRSYDPLRTTEAERLTHLILVDGVLVEFWSEQVAGTRWEHHARARDQRLAVRFPPAPPEPPAHERMLTWLDGLVGGRAALLSLTSEAHRRPVVPIEAVDSWADEALTSAVDPVLAALDRVAKVWFDDEVRELFRDAVRLVVAADPLLLAQADIPEKVAGGVVWAVGKANDLLGQGKVVTHTAVARQLGIGTTLSGGSRIQRVLHRPGVETGIQPQGCPDLLPLGRPTLLTSATRRDLVTWRDAALEDAKAYERSVAPPQER